jgi:hypothetical protein
MTHQADPKRYISSLIQSLTWLKLVLIFPLSVFISVSIPLAHAQPSSDQAEIPDAREPQQVSSQNTSGSVTSDQEDQAISQDESMMTPKAQQTFDQVISRLAMRAVERLYPDVRNGLIRVTVPTTQGSIRDRPSREVLAAALAYQISQQPNVFVVDPTHTINVLRNFDGLALPLTEERSISLGQHLGARYILLTDLSAGSSVDTLTLKVRMISIKRRGEVYKDQVEISRTDYQSLRDYAVFDERKLGATWRSAILPGWGQLYQKRMGGAIAYMSLTVGLIVGAIWAQKQGQKAADRYQENIPNTVNYRFEANHHFARARVMWGALGVTWLSATLSAYLQGEDHARVQLNFDPARGGLNISGAF